MCLPPSFDYMTPKEKLMSLEDIREHHALLSGAVSTERRERMRAGEPPQEDWLRNADPERHPAEFAWAEHVEEHRQAKERRMEIRRLSVVGGHLVGVTK